MAEIKVPTTVTGPDQITVPLVRGDYMGVSNVFRVLFEFALAFTATLVGVVLSIPTPTTLHFVFLAATAAASLVFAGFTIFYHRKASAPGRAAGSSVTAPPRTPAPTAPGFLPTFYSVRRGKKPEP